MEKELYQWQKECLERWFANNGRGMVQAVTGSGKTLLALTVARRLEKTLDGKLHVKIVVPTAALMRQWNRELRQFLANSDFSGESMALGSLQGEIGMRGGGCKDSADRKYMIYVINSARYELARQILAELRRGEAVFLIADECHRYDSGQNRLIFEFLPYIKPYEPYFFSMGLSATLPFGEARRYLATVLGPKIYSYGMDEASARRTICQYDVYHIRLSFESGEREEYEELTERMAVLYNKLVRTHPILKNIGQKERFEMLRRLAGDKDRRIAEAASLYMRLSFKRKRLVCLASARTVCACDLIERLDSREKILIFGERIGQVEELYRLMEEKYSGRVGKYHSKMGQQANKNILERFRMGDIRILIACKAMDEGIDIPDASVGIILSGTSTRRQRVQRLGRIIRKKEGKSRAALYYLHIAETSEDSCFLPDAKKNRIFELEYFSDRHVFSNPRYDEAAKGLLEEMRRGGMDGERLREAERCLRQGCVRSDWLMGRSDIEERIERARYTSEKNYWVCMKRLGAGILKQSV